ncbi:peptidoglycan-binding protein [Eubacteriales bacterium OttesenSCG-928-N13]|nr:peptidoglycan-binding protein [Eubacteriales bacterium OttesenSCG-928-N13]
MALANVLSPEAARKQAVRLIKSIAGHNSYTQSSNRCYVFGKPEGAKTGYGDCSSTVREVLKRAWGIDIGGNTSAQVSSRGKGILVEDNRGGTRRYPTLSKLKPGDCIYYKGTPGNTWGVGHVEMVTGDNECYGHGSGTGPKRHTITTYSKSRSAGKGYLCVIRWIKDDAKVYKLGERALSLGMVAPDVGELQQMLLKLGHSLGTYGAQKNGVDSDYGGKTAAAVHAEQKCAHLTQTGNADLVTIAHIVAHAMGGAAPAQTQYVRVTGGTVNVRKGASTRFSSLGIANHGQRLLATGAVADGWFEIRYTPKGKSETTAWISGRYAEIE